jgi:polysaccharide export protein, bexD/ctrA/vexA family
MTTNSFNNNYFKGALRHGLLLSASRLHVWIIAVCAMMATSCNTIKDIAYLQDISTTTPITLQNPEDIRLEPGDQLSISIHGRDPKVVEIYNMPNVTNATGGSTKASYTVNANGQIDMLQFGLIPVAGLTRAELANQIKYRLVSSGVVRDPVVVVDFATMTYSVLGEVAMPGRKPIDRDHMTLLDALAQAGDLTIYGKRNNVLVMRNVNGKQTAYRIDLTNTESVYASPVFNLKQNDIIYVEPNTKRANESVNNANTLRTPTFWFSAITLLTTVLLYIKK